jgi:hypothetical protein
MLDKMQVKPKADTLFEVEKGSSEEAVTTFKNALDGSEASPAVQLKPGWQSYNKERIALIKKRRAVGLSTEEEQRLENLQLLVRQKIKETIPKPFSILDEIDAVPDSRDA